MKTLIEYLVYYNTFIIKCVHSFATVVRIIINYVKTKYLNLIFNVYEYNI